MPAPIFPDWVLKEEKEGEELEGKEEGEKPKNGRVDKKQQPQKKGKGKKKVVEEESILSSEELEDNSEEEEASRAVKEIEKDVEEDESETESEEEKEAEVIMEDVPRKKMHYPHQESNDIKNHPPTSITNPPHQFQQITFTTASIPSKTKNTITTTKITSTKITITTTTHQSSLKHPSPTTELLSHRARKRPRKSLIYPELEQPATNTTIENTVIAVASKAATSITNVDNACTKRKLDDIQEESKEEESEKGEEEAGGGEEEPEEYQAQEQPKKRTEELTPDAPATDEPAMMTTIIATSK